jgi:hypothetical protein
MFRPGVAQRGNEMYTSLGAAALFVALLVVMFYCARMLLPLISPALRILIILLVTIVALYVIVVLLGFVGIHVPVPGFR